MQIDIPQTYRNAMESLVAEELDRQLKRVPAKLAQYIQGHNRSEVIAYALNRLPPMYATSEQGWQQQRQRAKNELEKEIIEAVRQALAAVQQDPLRISTPLKFAENAEAVAALIELKDLLQCEELCWKNLVDTVEQTLIETNQGKINWRKRSKLNIRVDRFRRQL